MIKVLYNDITKIATDAIVNAANSSLLGGRVGGVDGAIHRAGGRTILDECIQIRNRQGGCEVGKAVITTAGNLPAKYVIHTVGPFWYGGHHEERQLLMDAYVSCLEIALDKGIRSISFPNISTGVYRFPKKEAARIAINTILDYLKKKRVYIDVYFVCFEDDNFDIYKTLLADIEK
jgi:O-acetyl-ADP-ribose deacetylase (regulator of RNase III)